MTKTCIECGGPVDSDGAAVLDWKPEQTEIYCLCGDVFTSIREMDYHIHAIHQDEAEYDPLEMNGM